MSPTRKPFRIESRVTTWKNADGTESDVVRLFGGTRSLAVDFTELPHLIRQLEEICAKNSGVDYYLDNLFVEDTK